MDLSTLLEITASSMPTDLGAGGPGSGRRPKSGTPEAKKAAWLDPRQKSIFGPGHTKEIAKNAEEGKTRTEWSSSDDDDVAAGGPGSGCNPEAGKCGRPAGNLQYKGLKTDPKGYWIPSGPNTIKMFKELQKAAAGTSFKATGDKGVNPKSVIATANWGKIPQVAVKIQKAANFFGWNFSKVKGDFDQEYWKIKFPTYEDKPADKPAETEPKKPNAIEVLKQLDTPVKSGPQVQNVGTVTREQLRNTVADYAKQVGGYDNLRMPAAGKNQAQWNNLVGLYAKLGMTEADLKDHASRISGWVGHSTQAFADVAQMAVYGKKFSSNDVKAMAVEHMVTENVLREKYPNGIDLHRGIGGSYAQAAVASIENSTVLVLKTRGADSWSEDKYVAKNFGSITLSNKFDPSMIVSSYRSNGKFIVGEEEFVVVPPGKILIMEDHKVSGKGMYASEDRSGYCYVFPVDDEANFNWLHKRNISAGGPGSGRHKEIGNMAKLAKKAGYTPRNKTDKFTSFNGPKGQLLIIRHAGPSWEHHTMGPKKSYMESGKTTFGLRNFFLGTGDVKAGGPGSGCKGDNCGRPEGSGKKSAPAGFKKFGQKEIKDYVKQHTQQATKPSKSVYQEKKAIYPLAPTKTVLQQPEKEGKTIKGPKGQPPIADPYHPMIGQLITKETQAEDRERRAKEAADTQKNLDWAKQHAGEKSTAPKFHENDLVRIEVPVKLWNDRVQYFRTEKAGTVGEIHKVTPGKGGAPNMYEVFPVKSSIREDYQPGFKFKYETPGGKEKQGYSQGQVKSKIDAIHLREDEMSLYRAYKPGPGQHGYIAPAEKTRAVQQEVPLPGGGKLQIGRPIADDKPVTSGRISVPSGKLWPEQSYWKQGQPLADKHELKGRFQAVEKDIGKFNLDNYQPSKFSTTSIYDAKRSYPEEKGTKKEGFGTTLIVEKNKLTGTGRVIEINHDANNNIQAKVKGQTIVDSGVKTVKFSNPLAQQTFMWQRYGLKVKK